MSEFSDNEENTTSPASQGTPVVRAVYQPSQWTRNPVRLSYVSWFNVRRTGPTRNPNQDSKPLDYFLLFFDDRTWDIMVRETNCYAAQVRSSSSFPHQRPWRDVDHQEMKAFIGLIIAFGIIKLPRIEMYWQRKYPIFGIPAISQVMSLVRCEQIWRFFHLADSAKQVTFGQAGHDKLYKVREFLDVIQENFSANYILPCQVTVDECMIPFKGCLSFKNKPKKWGIKGYVLACGKTGYAWRILIYCGKGTIEGEDISSNQAVKVVLHLMEVLHGRGHELYTDNFYTSPQLCSQLLDKGITTCGTVRKDRKDFPKDLVFAKGHRNVPRGEHHYRFNGPVTAVAWFDCRPVYFLTTIHSAPPPGTYTVARQGDNGRTIAVPAPPCMIDYTMYMRGVD